MNGESTMAVRTLTLPIVLLAALSSAGCSAVDDVEVAQPREPLAAPVIVADGDLAQQASEVLEVYCFRCHNARSSAGGFDAGNLAAGNWSAGTGLLGIGALAAARAEPAFRSFVRTILAREGGVSSHTARQPLSLDGTALYYWVYVAAPWPLARPRRFLGQIS